MRKRRRRKPVHVTKRAIRITEGGLHPLNMSYPFILDEKVYPSLEHFIQASRCADEDWAELVRLSRTTREANRLSHFILAEQDPSWSVRQRHQLKRAMRARIMQHPILLQQLMDTGKELLLVRYASYMKVTDLDGTIALQQNLIGELWAELRRELTFSTLEDKLKEVCEKV